MNEAAEVLRRILRSMDLPHMESDQYTAAQAGRDLLEKLGMPVRHHTPELIKRAKAVDLLPYREAQKYGDGHPIGTYTIDVDLECALFMEKRFSMVTGNAPDGYDIAAIVNDDKRYDMSVCDEREEDDMFITLTCRDLSGLSEEFLAMAKVSPSNIKELFTMMVGPERLQDAVEALEAYGVNKAAQ